MKSKTSVPRLLYIDNLRALMIILVVMIHVAVTYSGIGMWYYKENASIDMISTVFFGIFQSFTQAFFMSLLFLFAGYFVVGSLDRKGTQKFVLDRLLRLGVPTLFFMLLLHPISVKLAKS